MVMNKPIPMGQAAVIKELIDVPSGHQAEAIYYNRPDKQVICLSSQLSCAVGCVFCASPDDNKTVNLTSDDMIAQIDAMAEHANSDTVMLYSFMGEGEPMQNYANLVDTIDHLIKTSKSPFRVAVSTSGIKPAAIVKFAHYVASVADEEVTIKLQLSLHAPTDGGRKRIMPLTKPLADVMGAMNEYRRITNGEIDINYTLIKDLNDTIDDAQALVELCKAYHVKISKYNNVPWLDWTESDNTEAFLAVLETLGLSHEFHMTDGEKDNAACGQTRGRDKPLTNQ